MDQYLGKQSKPSADKRQVFGIRKLSVGVASVGLASLFVLGQIQEVHADELSLAETDTTVGRVVEPVEETAVLTEGELSEETEVNPIPTRLVSDVATDDQVADGSLRLHFKALPEEPLDSLGLWTWEDVETPSSTLGAWPNAATNFATAKQDDYGYYLDVKMKDKPQKLGFLINNTAGQNITGDQFVEFISPKMNHVWLDKDYKVNYSEPLAPGKVRLNYFRTDGDYTNKSLWVWGDVENVTLGDWPNGIDFTAEGPYGRYIDIDLKEAANNLGFLLLDEGKTGDDVKIQKSDYKFTEVSKYSQLFVRDDDPVVYTNPYFVNNVRVLGVTHSSVRELEATFSTLEGVTKEDLLSKISVTDKDGKEVSLSDVIPDVAANKVKLTGDFNQEGANYTVTYGNEQFTTKMSWQLKDSVFAYDGELGARVSDEGAKVDFTLWSPSADKVTLVLYDKDDQTRVLGKTDLAKGDKGEWHLTLGDNALGLADYRGYFYHYEITRGDETVLVLDPYAKSLAAWDSSLADKGAAYKIAKAAIVDPSEVGPKDLTYANIANFKRREDAIIYEAHVRDFTSDKAIADELKNQFGTFAAFAERLDYLQDLGVTHVQLLPVMSYYYVNELKNAERLDEYASSNSNYNWGYDPQSYFALTGMYSTDPTNPLKRIEEFKHLVNEIHKRGMGVILDVVYNHTARTFIFEDLEPNYYHFMDADGTAKSSFGGGRLGTTHHMSRRVMVDSIKYMVDEFKVDGFRFDMMGDHDAASVEMAFNAAKALNPNVIMLGEGWRTYAGDTNYPEKPADQDWMSSTDTVAVFSDDIRNTLKSGFPNEGTPAFITNGAKSVETVFKNIKAQPTNFDADSPGDVIQYIAAHDNLTLYDIIAQSIKKDPSKPEHDQEIHRRLRLGNVLVLTAQGTPFLHSGQEYGRTKHFKHEDYRYPVSEDKVPNKAHLLVNEDGTPFDYPYYIHDSYDSSDAINHFDWTKATDDKAYPENTRSQAFVRGLIALRKSTEAFRLPSKADVDAKVTLLTIPDQNGVAKEDLVIAYSIEGNDGERYAVFVNADMKAREFILSEKDRALLAGDVLVDGERAGIDALDNPVGVTLGTDRITLAPLTATVIRLTAKVEKEPDTPETSEKPQNRNGVELLNADSSNERPTATELGKEFHQEADKMHNVIAETEATEGLSSVAMTTTASSSEKQASLPKTGESGSMLLLGLTNLLGALGLRLKRRQ
ncbi:pullulanase [Streptococcus fryi]